jgi:hypothetical protein
MLCLLVVRVFLCGGGANCEPLFSKKRTKVVENQKKNISRIRRTHASFSCVILSDSYARALRYRCARRRRRRRRKRRKRRRQKNHHHKYDERLFLFCFVVVARVAFVRSLGNDEGEDETTLLILARTTTRKRRWRKYDYY